MFRCVHHKGKILRLHEEVVLQPLDGGGITVQIGNVRNSCNDRENQIAQGRFEISGKIR